MNADLKNFAMPVLRVIAATLFLVFCVAFVSVPYSLGALPGEPVVAQQASTRHMT
jgi:hypothetical protein